MFIGETIVGYNYDTGNMSVGTDNFIIQFHSQYDFSAMDGCKKNFNNVTK